MNTILGVFAWVQLRVTLAPGNKATTVVIGHSTPERGSQAFSDVLLNASKFIEGGGRIALRVKDDGALVEPEVQSNSPKTTTPSPPLKTYRLVRAGRRREASVAI